MSKKFFKIASSILGVGTVTAAGVVGVTSCSSQSQTYEIKYSGSNKLNFKNNQVALSVSSNNLQVNNVI